MTLSLLVNVNLLIMRTRMSVIGYWAMNCCCKNYLGSFSSNVQDDIDKTREKAGMIFSANFDRRKVNQVIYVKLWWQACLPTLLYGSELFTLTSSLSKKLERCQLCQEHILCTYVYTEATTPEAVWTEL